MTLDSSVKREKRFLDCPNCKASLKVVLEDGVEVDACESCKGVWVDTVEEKAVLEMKPDVFTVEELRKIRKIYEPFSKTDPVRYRPCPVCHELMNRKNWGAHSGVVVDKCDQHGAWYDEDELEKIREFVAAGGVELEKLKIATNGIDNLQGKLERVALRLDKKIDGAYRRARLWSWLGL
jgi:Zn-finger nucleic acid-binding protein